MDLPQSCTNPVIYKLHTSGNNTKQNSSSDILDFIFSPAPMLTYCHLDLQEQILVKF